MQCQLCKKQFRTKVKIDDKIRNLGNRKYCLECSPFKNHNTKKLFLNNSVEINLTEKECRICLQILPINLFYIRLLRNKYIYDSACKKCSNKECIERQRKLKQQCVEYKGSKCLICNYDKCINNLQFHHLDPSKKEFSISHSKSRSFNVLKSELDKCILVCANCHGEIHAGLINI